MIIAAAIRFPAHDPHKPEIKDFIAFVPPPGRHHNVIGGLWYQFYGTDDVMVNPRKGHSYTGEVQGFLTDKGEFLNRREAFLHVKACGQRMIREMGKGYQGDELFSEDLW